MKIVKLFFHKLQPALGMHSKTIFTYMLTILSYSNKLDYLE